MPLETHKKVRELIEASIQDSAFNFDNYFTVVSSPEFLAEGCAIRNLTRPDRIVIGTPTNHPNGPLAFKIMQSLYKAFPCPLLHTHTSSSELGKLFSNAMLAQRISSINSLSSLCEQTEGASIQDLKNIAGSDQRIGNAFLNASPGFGGSCFEKDIMSLVYILESRGLQVEADYWKHVLKINDH